MHKFIKVILLQLILFIFSCTSPEEKNSLEQSKIDSFNHAETIEAMKRADEMIENEKKKDSLNLKIDSSRSN